MQKVYKKSTKKHDASKQLWQYINCICSIYQYINC